MDPLPILKDLIAIPSVNPMGRDLDGPEYFETRLTAYLSGFFSKLNVDHRVIEVVPGRANVLAWYHNRHSRATILMDAHQDTVPTDGMMIDPFDPVETEGKLYGRGACDVKGGMAAMLAAFARLVEEEPSTAANVVMSCTCDEEATTLGINALVDMWSGASGSIASDESLLASAPDLALVAEPTDLDIVVAHRGATRWKIRTTGRACHSSRPQDGISAIYRMARLLGCLEEFANKLPAMVPAHRLCGPATLSVGRIEGGISVNTVPDRCEIEIDRRVIPGEDGLEVIEQVGDYLRERLDFDFEMLDPWLVGMSLSDDDNQEWADRLMTQISAVVGARRKVGVPYGTHASRTSAAGVPSIVFGPGSVAQAHTKDEWISIAELRQASEIYYRFCASAGME